MKKVYKICSKTEWLEAKKTNLFTGSKADKKDGFIHLSSYSQVRDTAKLHFKNKKNCMLLELKTENLKIKWERSRNGDLFPHLYGTFDLVEVNKFSDLPLGQDNDHAFPEWFNQSASN
jgi:uncharacterized protein (DUF952 family)